MVRKLLHSSLFNNTIKCRDIINIDIHFPQLCPKSALEEQDGFAFFCEQTQLKPPQAWSDGVNLGNKRLLTFYQQEEEL